MRSRNWNVCVGFAVLFVFMVTGCGGPSIKNVTRIERSRYSEGAIVETDPAKVPEYIIGTGDVLAIKVMRHPELSGSVKVGSYGEVRMPESADMVIAAGKTTSEVEKEIKVIISSYMKLEPVVVVEVEAFNSKFIYVLGAVRDPGKYALRENLLSLRAAIFRAGMPVGDAALKRVIVVNPDFEEPIATGINFEEIMYGGRMKYNIVLREGDIVFIPFTTFSKTVKALDRFATPMGKAAGGLAAALYIKENLGDED